MKHLAELVVRLKPAGPVNWSPPANLHITLKFIGDFPEERLPDLIVALEQIEAPAAFDITLRGLGWFPNPHSPRQLYVGVSAPPQLEQLQHATEEACAAMSIPPETRPFHPHVTIARIKAPEPLVALRHAIAELPSIDFGAMLAASHTLFSSERTPAGSLYKKLKVIPLAQ